MELEAAHDFTDKTAISPTVGGESNLWTIHPRPSKYLRDENTLLVNVPTHRSSEKVEM